MPKRLYYFDTTQFEHTATVTAVEENMVELDETIFHPQGGGQPSDEGTINDIPVVKVIDHLDPRDPESEDRIQHVLAKAPDFKIGDQVSLKVEPAPRLLFSRSHTAGHLLAHIAQATYAGLEHPNGHHFPGEARVTFKYSGELPPKDEMRTTLLAKLEAAIKANTPVVSEWTPATGRTIEIAGFGKAPCGGTHVKSLGDIGEVTFRGIEAKKGTLKLSYNVG